MTNSEYKQHIDALSLKPKHIAKWFNVNERRAQYWYAGKMQPPDEIINTLRRWAELGKPPPSSI